MKYFFLSIATYDYLSQLFCVESSLSKNNSIIESYIFVIDGKKEHVDFLNNKFEDHPRKFKFFCFDNIQNYQEIFNNALNYYDNFEMSCLAKAIGSKYVLDQINTKDILVYCDADLYFTCSIDPLIQEMGDKSLFLTPHILHKEKDSKDEQGYLIHGWINAGFMIFKKGNPLINEMLDWLIDRIYLRGFNAPSLSMFVDQAWVSALPYLFRDVICISSNPSSNVAYWNLNEREITKDYKFNKYQVNSENLIFFHFSGYSMNNTKVLSKHFDFKRTKKDYPQIFSLIEEYNVALLDADNIEIDLSSLNIDLYKFSNEKLRKRILISEQLNQISLINPTHEVGILSKLARKIEALILK